MPVSLVLHEDTGDNHLSQVSHKAIQNGQNHSEPAAVQTQVIG